MEVSNTVQLRFHHNLYRPFVVFFCMNLSLLVFHACSVLFDDDQMQGRVAKALSKWYDEIIDERDGQTFYDRKIYDLMTSNTKEQNNRTSSCLSANNSTLL